MSSPYTIVKRPVVSEKVNLQQERFNQYTFEVDRASNKHEIQRAIEELFSVKVTSIRVIHVRGKKRRMGMRYRKLGRTASWKKAIVTLEKGQTIDILGERV
ncbi:MAG TPA: 50S ribosomal protein L23 [Candidatus Latescibacteria bacterium]|jgi:large subunit ribosomal protein L23|nr:50S ribosomal protein L23 [Candidatus Latescibacterota bacterium]HQI76807.1 50S ribosomal protein L23 [Candidatus Latescibacterota bacterium]